MNARVKNAQLENSLKNTFLISGTTVVNPIFIYYHPQVCEVQSPTLDTGKVLRKILLHPGQFVLPRRIYRDCRGLDAEGALVRMNELVEEGHGSLVQRTQQQKVFYKALPTLDIEDSLRSHGINPDEYRAQFFEVDYKVIESQRNSIHNANPDRELLPLLDENHGNEIEEMYSNDDNNSHDDYDGDDDENSGGNNGDSCDDGNGAANSVNNDTSDGSGDETSNNNGTGGDSGDNGSGGDESSDNGSGENEIVDNEIVDNESDDNESGDHASDDNGNGSSIDDDSDDGRRRRNWAE